MMIEERVPVVIVGPVVDVYRRCKECLAWKPLKHYLLHRGNGMAVYASVHRCAACRSRGPE